jgi:CheY-like chemotaxis protein
MNILHGDRPDPLMKERPMSPPRRVLLVDDHDHVRFSLRQLLEGKGHTVEEAEDGLDGVRKAVAWRPHVAVVDIELPVIDGYGLARRVREALGDEVRLIALTGHDNRDRAFEAGFDAHLLKPADAEQIHRLVQEGR